MWITPKSSTKTGNFAKNILSSKSVILLRKDILFHAPNHVRFLNKLKSQVTKTRVFGHFWKKVAVEPDVLETYLPVRLK